VNPKAIAFKPEPVKSLAHLQVAMTTVNQSVYYYLQMMNADLGKSIKINLQPWWLICGRSRVFVCFYPLDDQIVNHTLTKN
jgi:hypothetical protein